MSTTPPRRHFAQTRARRTSPSSPTIFTLWRLTLNLRRVMPVILVPTPPGISLYRGFQPNYRIGSSYRKTHICRPWSRLFLVLYSSIGFLLAFAEKLSLQGVGVLHLVRCGKPFWILKGCDEARSIPADLMSATPKRAHVANFGVGRGRCCRAKWVARMIRHGSSRTIGLN